MKKLLFSSLLLLAFVVIAGCADESGSNGGGGNSETCPITSADFTYEKIPQDSYKIKYQMSLNNDNKNQYQNTAKWIGGYNRVLQKPVEYTKLEPTLIWEKSPSPQREATFYYNNKQCGDTIILKPISTYRNCDNITVGYYQGNASYNDSNKKVHFLVLYNGDVDLSLISELKFNNGYSELRSEITTERGHQFSVPYSKIENTVDRTSYDIYADLIIKYPNNEYCTKEVSFTLR